MDIFFADKNICNNCENFSTKFIKNHPICLLNLENIKHKTIIDNEDNGCLIEIEEENAEEKLSTVPMDCPFYLEQLMEKEDKIK